MYEGEQPGCCTCWVSLEHESLSCEDRDEERLVLLGMLSCEELVANADGD